MRDVARALLHALDPVAFARDRLGFEADDVARRAAAVERPVGAGHCSRQAGKSTTAAVLALHTALYRPGSLVLLVAPSLRQAGELFRKFAEMRGRLDPAPALSEDNAALVHLRRQRLAGAVACPAARPRCAASRAPALIVEDEAARVPDDAVPGHPADAGDGAGRAADPDERRRPGSSGTSGRSGRRAARTGSGSRCRPSRCRASTPRSLRPSGGRSATLGTGRSTAASSWPRPTPVFRPEDVARAISAEVEPLFPTAPVAGDPLPLFPRGVPVPPRSAMNRFWPGALTWTHYLVGVCPSEPGQPVAVAVVAQSIGTTTKGQHATLELQLRHLEEVPGGASLPDAAARVTELCAALDPLEESAPRGGAGARHRRARHHPGRPAGPAHAGAWSRSPAGRSRACSGRGVAAVPRREVAAGLLLEAQRGTVPDAPARCRWRRGSRRRCRASGSGRRRAGGGRRARGGAAGGGRRARARGRAVRVAEHARGAGVAARRRVDPRRSVLGDYDPHAGLDATGDPRPRPGPAARPGRAGGGRAARRGAPGAAAARHVLHAGGRARRGRSAAGGARRSWWTRPASAGRSLDMLATGA